jgi:hypothetical protein
MAAGVYGQAHGGGWGGAAGTSSGQYPGHRILQDPGQFPGVDRLPLQGGVGMQHSPVREYLAHVLFLYVSAKKLDVVDP